MVDSIARYALVKNGGYFNGLLTNGVPDVTTCNKSHRMTEASCRDKIDNDPRYSGFEMVRVSQLTKR